MLLISEALDDFKLNEYLNTTLDVWYYLQTLTHLIQCHDVAAKKLASPSARW